jgi:monoamine oxidase
VHLAAPVRSIAQRPDHVVVTADDVVATARHVVVTVPPALALEIEFDPLLPDARTALYRNAVAGPESKTLVVYDEPFWRAEGLNGQLISDLGPGRMSNDTCPVDGSHGQLLVFLEGEQARTVGRWPEQDRREALTAELVRHFGPRAASPELYVDGEWSERPWTRGCYNANMGPLVWTTFGHALVEPIGPIQWAATETATRWSAYMEGAVEAGERAAHEVVAALLPA